MMNPYIKQLPNVLTSLRLLLAVPVCIFILQERYAEVLWIAAIAAFTDGIDGWWARKMGVQSRFGAVVDPISDKALLMGAFVCLALVNAIPPGVAIIVVLRDLVIVGGALSYHWLIGRFQMAPTFWGKASTLVQVCYVLMVITQKVYPVFPLFLFKFGTLLVIALALISGGNYVAVWSRKAWTASQQN
ncbi:CDP-alcohol phosphatidyltransferase family protein [Gilvimarinus sp. F26214L]|uniref:CDP-alcohol phosphatidyltransferase family protein n=1 Tax=Gilvimarinus sp. DZF01 TaxID=3461371 RepID=UPI0040455E52